MSKNIIVIGSGFSGLSAAAYLAKAGNKVTILEKNESPGGRARKMDVSGYQFDMGPSWYWMPDVFDHFFADFGKKVSDYYELLRLDPGYKIVFGPNEEMSVPADYEELKALFESYEKGAADKLDQFMKEAAYKYEVGMGEFVFKPSHNIMEFADLRVLASLFKLQMLSSVTTQVEKLFQHRHLRELLKFPVLFLGATPEDTPAMYTLMNYADLKLGTWFPLKGMFQIVEAMVELNQSLGVEIKTDHVVERLEVNQKNITTIHTNKGNFQADIVVASADYHHVEQKLLTLHTECIQKNTGIKEPWPLPPSFIISALQRNSTNCCITICFLMKILKCMRMKFTRMLNGLPNHCFTPA